jgi:hypothetical protein
MHHSVCDKQVKLEDGEAIEATQMNAIYIDSR